MLHSGSVVHSHVLELLLEQDHLVNLLEVVDLLDVAVVSGVVLDVLWG